MRWGQFAAACPELARIGEERLRSRELCLIGTLRRKPAATCAAGRSARSEHTLVTLP
jgi:hypothetical protein